MLSRSAASRTPLRLSSKSWHLPQDKRHQHFQINHLIPVYNPLSKTRSRHCLCRWIEWTGEYLQTFMSLQPGLRSRSIIDNTNSSFYILVKGNRLFSISLRVDTLLWMVQRQDGCLPVWWPILHCASCILWLSGHSSMWGSPTISL